MGTNRLQLNTNKTDLIWYSISRRQSQLPCIPLTVSTDFISPSSSVHNLGIFLDADLTMRMHVQRTAAGGFAALSKLRSIRSSIPTCLPDIDFLAHCVAWITAIHATLIGIPASLSRHLQSVLDAAARSVAGVRRSDDITNTLASFHSLRVPERIQFKMVTLIYKSLLGVRRRHVVTTVENKHGQSVVYSLQNLQPVQVTKQMSDVVAFPRMTNKVRLH